jgi:hypothetical protein
MRNDSGVCQLARQNQLHHFAAWRWEEYVSEDGYINDAHYSAINGSFHLPMRAVLINLNGCSTHTD